MDTTDSLMSDLTDSDDEGKVVVEEIVAASPEIPVPEYSDEDLEQIIRYIKDMTVLFHKREEDWNETNTAVIKRWLMEVNELMLTIFYDGDELTAILTFPLAPVYDLTYFLRTPNFIFTVDSFHDDILYGKLDEDIDGSLLRLMEYVYAPIFFSNKAWPDNIKSRLCNDLNAFLTFLTELHYKISGLCVLYIPYEGCQLQTAQIIDDREMFKRIETVVHFWMNQIRLCLNDTKLLVPYELVCPTDVYDFWSYRYEALYGLNFQLNNVDVQRILLVLEGAQSVYLNQFTDIIKECQDELEKAKSNLEYLHVIVEPCITLEKSNTPAELPSQLLQIMHTIRVIWLNSDFYNTKETITELFQSLSNLVIIFCRKKIDVDKVLFGFTRTGIEMCNMSIDCCIAYKEIYKKVLEFHTKRNPDVGWNLDYPTIFNQVDAFIQRLVDMIEICEAMIVFGRRDETEIIPKPLFGGKRGKEFEKICEQIETSFNVGLTEIQTVSNTVMDVHENSWYDSVAKFRLLLRDLDEIIENLISIIFINIGNIEEALEALYVLKNFAFRKTLRLAYIRQTSNLWKEFTDSIAATNREILDHSHEHPSLLPFYSGRAIVLQIKLARLERLKNMLAEAEWLLQNTNSYNALEAFENLKISIKENITKLNDDWIDSVGLNLMDRLKRPLMCRSVTHGGLIECNIDRVILKLLGEAHFFGLMGLQCPANIMQVSSKSATIKNVYENVTTVVLDYNRILAALSSKERLLFKALIQVCERKITPGIYKLSWGGDLSDAYIAECVKYTSELQDFLDIYKMANLSVERTCEKICDTPILKITNTHPINLNKFENNLKKYRVDTTMQLLKYYQNFLDYIMIVYEGFKYEIDNMMDEWLDYIRQFDDLLQEAFLTCAKNTLTSIYTALHGDGTMGPASLINVEIDLVDNKLTFNPPIQSVSDILGNTSNFILSVIQKFPRICERYKLPTRDPVASLYEVIKSDYEYQRLNMRIDDEIRINKLSLQNYLGIWSPFSSQWELDKDMVMKEFEETIPTAQVFDQNIGKYTEVANMVSLQETITNVYFVVVNASKLKNSILAHIDDWQTRHTDMLRRHAYKKITYLYDYTKTNAEQVLVEPHDLVSVQNLIAVFNQLKNEVPIIEETFPSIRDHFAVLDKYEITISSGIRVMNSNMDQQWNWYLRKLKEADDMIDVCKDQFKLALLEETRDLKKEAKRLLDTFGENAPFTSALSAEEAIAVLREMRQKLEDAYKREARLIADLEVFGINQPENIELKKLDKELKSLEEVWDTVLIWEQSWAKYRSGNFWITEIDEMETTATELFRKFNRMCKMYKDKNWEILETTRRGVDEFRKTLPLIVALKNPAMRERHWDRVRGFVGIDFDENSEDFTLEAIIRMNFQAYSEEIQDVSNAATMELQIENGIKNIREVWENVKIEIIRFKPNIYRIKSVDDCFQVLEENAVQISAMKATRFVEPFAKEVDYWEKTLSYIMECLENCLTVQRQWLYLDNIFTGDDIRKQLPAEADQFNDLTEEWSDITRHMFKAKTALKATHYQPPNYLLNKLIKMGEKLEYVQRQLEIYLEVKRQAFPRFYFISNDDLLEILGNSKKPEMVQPHMKKLFDNVNKLKLNYNTSNVKHPKWEVHGMYSDDGEYIPYQPMLIIDGPAEKWLTLIEKIMRKVLRDLLKLTRQSLKRMLAKRDKWISMWPGQLCLTSSQLQWTTDCTRSLIHCKIMGEKKPLKRLRKKQNSVLSKLSEMSRKDLPKQLRLKVNSIITIEIHGRDVIDKMYKTNCTDVSHFEWFSQLRFYWDREQDDCVIRQTNTHFWYGYEYTGNSGRLVITPLTDRCYITLTTALHLYRGGSPKGPAGTGKTETVKDLGKALGMWVIVNNCSEGLDFKSMGKCFSGLVQTGCWGCFDEFNRINIEVLSVVAQQILSILTALAAGQKKFIFESYEIRLIPTVGLFITMNPGYAGRTELPDNLKSMFRPISMIVPDNIIIAENLLFSDGFQSTKSLAKKVFTLYELAKQQLSKQNHYDFGLRSMVALLRYAGRKRRQFPTANEEEMVYLAMKDMNIAKLTSDDFPLFNGIMSDIFPDVVFPVIDYEEFLVSIQQELTDLNLQKVPIAITKVIQLYETKNSRHSVMILGNTGTAKSVTWQVLKGAYGRMKKLGKPGWVEVFEYPVNPKALNLAELYGEYNLSTGEWYDGVLSSIMRKICSDESPDQKWMLFDGPVDAVWIENMNSVMDDNKILTLVNSERISMPEQVSLLFEVGDLTVASPATVSRCGMVYNDYKDWGWRPYIDSWLATIKVADYRVYLIDLIDRYIGKLLKFKRKLEETVPVNELNLIQSFCRLLDTFGTRENGIDERDPENLELMTKLWFLFAVIWSICATVNEPGRLKFDNFIREMEGVFPLKDTVYDYYVDPRQKTFCSWEDKLSDLWRYNKSLPFYKIIVPTIDTVRYDFLISNLVLKKLPVLLVGPVGTGKTSTALSVLDGLDSSRYSLLIVNMSAQTSSNNVQETIESRTEKRTKEIFVPIGGKTMITFMDDFNMPVKEVYGSQPPLELIRQWIDYGFWYDRLHQIRIYVKQMMLMAGMGPAGGGRQVVSPRTLSRFNVINMTFPSDHTITRIFGTMLGQHVNDFTPEVKTIAKDITIASFDLYLSVITKLLPTPAKIHYLFNLRDISRIFQGLLRSHHEYHTSKSDMLKLWMHESFRVFSDRLIDEIDLDWFINSVNQKLGKFFDVTFRSLCPTKEPPVYGDFISANGYYEELSNHDVLLNYMLIQLSDYNSSLGVVTMDLVLFREAIEHIVRIVRVVSQPRGNMLLIGIGGSGRQSLSRIGAYIAELHTFQIEVTKNYKIGEFREDLKALFIMAGVENKPTSFLFNDTQVAEESFMEILNNLLSTGEVSNLFKSEEFDELKTKLEHAATKAGIIQTTEALFTFFIDRVKSNLHIIICLSPIGDMFRMRIRMYPSLVNCTTIDWFKEWPKQALLEVASKYLQNCQLDVSITDTKEVNRESLIETTEHKLKVAVAAVMAIIHSSVSKMSHLMFMEIKRHNYVTPTNYLELVSGYQDMLNKKRIEISGNANKLRNGLNKIEDTREKVVVMSDELSISQEKVIEFQIQCDEFLIIIQAETVEADAKRQEVAQKSAVITIEEAEIKVLAAQAQVDLDKAMPALEAAMKALDALNKKDLTEVKSYGRPPPKVERVMESVMILLEKEPTWAEAKRQLGEQGFLEHLRNFDKDHISDKTLKKIAKFTQDPELEPEKVGIVSLACKSLILWVRAIERYGKIYKIVGPKKQRLEETLESLRIKQQLLREAQEQLAELNRRLEKLQFEFDTKSKEKEELRRRAEILKLQLERAHALVDGLAGERLRWIETVKILDNQFSLLPGNCLMAVGFISYLGPFVTNYRDDLIALWQDEVKKYEIPSSDDFSIVTFLTDATLVREWNIQGLPSDTFSIENGIIITKATRWPLVIDPQCQAVTWVKKMAYDNDLKVIDFGHKNFVNVLEVAIRLGQYVLLENVMEVLDPALTPILNRAIIRQGGQNLIKFNDKLISYNENFRFFITTKLPNPHYPPEISTKTTLVNFAVKEEGLQAQLLGIVVKKERPRLEEQKNSLVVNIAKNKKTLIDLENEILRLLNESRGSLLDDDELFSTLQNSKQTSAVVVETLAVAEVTEIEIDMARNGYKPSAHRASILFFVLMDMSRIDPMYQFSLDAYITLFIQSIEKSHKSPLLAERIQNLNDYHTQSVYRNTCRGLFEKHKLLFSFHMCVKILDADGKLNTVEYEFLLKGGIVLNRHEQIENPSPTWITDVAWDNITELDKLPGYHGVTDSFEQSSREWREWFATAEPEMESLVGEWNKVSFFQKMLFIRCLRADRITSCVMNYITNMLGPEFIEPPILDVKAVFEESVSKTPLIFVLSPGVDPTSILLQLAETVKMSKQFKSLSLGQGQAPIATQMISEGVTDGSWVFLANCHLSLSWMPDLDKIVDKLQHTKIHKKFRLWLSSSPHPDFPISILQAGIKMTTEPPKGLKANLKRLYNLISDEQFVMCKAKEKYKKLLFALCFFHSILLERKKFQQLGWNIVYSFNDSDFEVSENLLTIYLDEYEETPWDALKYLVSDVNYGGHVTDDWDRRLNSTYINQFFNDDVLYTNQYRLTSLSTYFIPKDGILQSYKDYITLLPNFDRPEVFGQHPNADIASLISETRLLFETLTSLQVQSSDLGGESKEDKVTKLAVDILSKLPSPIDYEGTVKLIGPNKKPLDVILLQEIGRYNLLIKRIKNHLDVLQNAIKGLVVMSADLEDIFFAMFEARVPSVWLTSYSSLKPLGSWARDLVQRIEHFSKWAKTVRPPLLFWLSAYTFPTGFLTAVLQTSSRLNKIPIDALSWEFNVFISDETLNLTEPADGVYISGLYLEGAGWDKRLQALKEPLPMELITPMPIIHFKPTELTRKRTRGFYQCPSYYLPQRAGNFVIAIDLKSGTESSDFWIKRGTAILLSLSD